MPGLLVGLALAGSSIFVFPGIGDTIREPKWIWLWAFAGIGLIFMLRSRRWPEFPVAGFPLLGYFFAQPYFFSPAERVWPFTLCFLSLLILGSTPTPTTSEEKVTKYLQVATWLQLGLGALQMAGWDPIFHHFSTPGAHPLAGFIGQQTLFGAWVAALAWFWFAHRKPYLFVACSAAAFLTGAAFTALAWVAGLCAWLLWRKPRLGLGVSAIFATGALLGFLTRKGFFWDNYRLRAWRMLVSAWLERPWFGYGLDSFAREFPYRQGFSGPPWLQAHSEPLELLFGGGLIGWLVALLAISALWFRRKYWWGREDCLPWFLVLAAVAANSLGSFPLHIAPLALLAAMAYFRLASRVAV